jgi:3'-5' exoribonuclease
MKTIYVTDLQKNQVLTGESFLIFESEKMLDKHGNEYCNLTIGDKTGRIQAKIWSEKLAGMDSSILKSGSIIQVSAKVDEFRGQIQLTILEARGVDEGALEDFLETSEYDADEMMQSLQLEIDSIKNESLRAVLNKILNDDEIKRRYKFWPAAVSVHHDFRSGLLQHVLEMIEISKGLHRFYPDADFDILKAGIILHDIGKLYELDASGVATSYSRMGILAGHIVIGVMIFEQFGGKELDDKTYLQIVHLILSHHGVLEYGSPVIPATIEAIMLTHIDNLSAKTRTAVKAKRGIPSGQEFSAYNNWLEGARIWKGEEGSSNQPSKINSGQNTSSNINQYDQLSF